MPTGAELNGLDAYDQQLGLHPGQPLRRHAKYVTGNLNLWPRPLVIIANPEAYQRLTDDQRAIMATAAKDTIPVAMEAERSEDATAITALCRAGLTFAQSSDADLAALQNTLDPVYTTINDASGNAAATEQIETVKDSLHRAPDDADCTNVPADGHGDQGARPAPRGAARAGAGVRVGVRA